MRRLLPALSAALLALALAASGRHTPQVLKTDPAEGATGVARRGLVVRITFSQAMDPASLHRGTVSPGYVDPGLRFVRDPFTATAYAYDPATRTLSVGLPDLLPAQEVRLDLTDQVRTVDGKPLSGEGPVRFCLRFTTRGEG